MRFLFSNWSSQDLVGFKTISILVVAMLQLVQSRPSRIQDCLHTRGRYVPTGPVKTQQDSRLSPYSWSLCSNWSSQDLVGFKTVSILVVAMFQLVQSRPSRIQDCLHTRGRYVPTGPVKTQQDSRLSPYSWSLCSNWSSQDLVGFKTVSILVVAMFQLVQSRPSRIQDCLHTRGRYVPTGPVKTQQDSRLSPYSWSLCSNWSSQDLVGFKTVSILVVAMFQLVQSRPSRIQDCLHTRDRYVPTGPVKTQQDSRLSPYSWSLCSNWSSQDLVGFKTVSILVVAMFQLVQSRPSRIQDCLYTRGRYVPTGPVKTQQDSRLSPYSWSLCSNCPVKTQQDSRLSPYSWSLCSNCPVKTQQYSRLSPYSWSLCSNWSSQDLVGFKTVSILVVAMFQLVQSRPSRIQDCLHTRGRYVPTGPVKTQQDSRLSPYSWSLCSNWSSQDLVGFKTVSILVVAMFQLVQSRPSRIQDCLHTRGRYAPTGPVKTQQDSRLSPYSWSLCSNWSSQDLVGFKTVSILVVAMFQLVQSRPSRIQDCLHTRGRYVPTGPVKTQQDSRLSPYSWSLCSNWSSQDLVGFKTVSILVVAMFQLVQSRPSRIQDCLYTRGRYVPTGPVKTQQDSRLSPYSWSLCSNWSSQDLVGFKTVSILVVAMFQLVQSRPSRIQDCLYTRGRYVPTGPVKTQQDSRLSPYSWSLCSNWSSQDLVGFKTVSILVVAMFQLVQSRPSRIQDCLHTRGRYVPTGPVKTQQDSRLSPYSWSLCSNWSSQDLVGFKTVSILVVAMFQLVQSRPSRIQDCLYTRGRYVPTGPVKTQQDSRLSPYSWSLCSNWSSQDQVGFKTVSILVVAMFQLVQSRPSRIQDCLYTRGRYVPTGPVKTQQDSRLSLYSWSLCSNWSSQDLVGFKTVSILVVAMFQLVQSRPSRIQDCLHTRGRYVPTGPVKTQQDSRLSPYSWSLCSNWSSQDLVGFKTVSILVVAMFQLVQSRPSRIQDCLYTRGRYAPTGPVKTQQDSRLSPYSWSLCSNWSSQDLVGFKTVSILVVAICSNWSSQDLVGFKTVSILVVAMFQLVQSRPSRIQDCLHTRGRYVPTGPVKTQQDSRLSPYSWSLCSNWSSQDLVGFKTVSILVVAMLQLVQSRPSRIQDCLHTRGRYVPTGPVKTQQDSRLSLYSWSLYVPTGPVKTQQDSRLSPYSWSLCPL